MHLLQTLALPSLTFITTTSAAYAFFFTCAEGNNPYVQMGSTASIGQTAQWVGVPKGCKKQVTYTARSGIESPLLAFREFDGPNDFHGNVNFFSSNPGAKIRQGSKEIVLGKPDEDRKLNADEKRYVCTDVGYAYNHPLDKLSAKWFIWNDVGSLGPCRD